MHYGSYVFLTLNLLFPLLLSSYIKSRYYHLSLIILIFPHLSPPPFLTRFMSFSVEFSDHIKSVKYMKHALFTWSLTYPDASSGFRFFSLYLAMFPIEVTPLRLIRPLLCSRWMLIFITVTWFHCYHHTIPISFSRRLGKRWSLHGVRLDQWLNLMYWGEL